MSKKILKSLICIISITTVIAGVIYFIFNKKKENSIDEEDDEFEEEALDAGDVLDLSSLKFSRNYVDLR